MLKWTMRMGFLAVVLSAAACTDNGECDRCQTDEDCNSEFVCRNFVDDNGNIVDRRCASGVGATTCRTR